MNRRRAVSLIELVVIMSACAVILTLSTSLMQRVMRTQSSARSFFDRERSALRLSQQFRRDVRQATSVISSPADGLSKGFLILRLSQSQTVEYREQAGIVRRTLLEGDHVLARDEFAFQHEIEVAVVQKVSPPLITLSLTNRAITTDDGLQPMGATEKPIRLYLQARLGHDNRYADATPDREVPE